jgi:hypothetical protein
MHCGEVGNALPYTRFFFLIPLPEQGENAENPCSAKETFDTTPINSV